MPVHGVVEAAVKELEAMEAAVWLTNALVDLVRTVHLADCAKDGLVCTRQRADVSDSPLHVNDGLRCRRLRVGPIDKITVQQRQARRQCENHSVPNLVREAERHVNSPNRSHPECGQSATKNKKTYLTSRKIKRRTPPKVSAAARVARAVRGRLHQPGGQRRTPQLRVAAIQPGELHLQPASLRARQPALTATPSSSHFLNG